MAHHKSAIRQQRRSVRRRAINQRNISGLRSKIKKVKEAIKSKNKEEAQKLLPKTFSLIDKTVKKGTIHENRGSRYKSRLSRQVEKITPAVSK